MDQSCPVPHDGIGCVHVGRWCCHSVTGQDCRDSSSLDVVQTISLCLTLICAGAFALVFLGIIVREICLGRFDSGCQGCIVTSLLIAIIAFPVFMIAILIKEVFLKGEDDPPFEGGIELASYIVYGIGAFFIGLLSILFFTGRFDR